ncbi:uncharacterized protein LOC131872082 [Cryptomeria japonica]|uniref:uncharacterized protein LOC131872082 n=1 Tax=Cryptomeria japonica TaxID=3369 RepID=UPI0027DAB060|nr:uncharacterized protein LOC131872082 [Cryptomeria japonica]
MLNICIRANSIFPKFACEVSPHFLSTADANLLKVVHFLCSTNSFVSEQYYKHFFVNPTKLQKLILSEPELTLMIWMRADLKNLLFEGQGYKTLVKSRDNSTISTTPTTQLYQLPLLCPEDVLSLLCFWAFVQPPIPILRHCRCKYGEGESSVATAR